MPAIPPVTRQWFLKAKPTGKLDVSEHLELRRVPLFDGSPKAGKILVKITHIQLDPTNLIWLSSSPALAIDRLYVPPTEVGAPVIAGTAGRVIASWDPGYSIGDRVYGYWNWAEHVVVDIAYMNAIGNPTSKIPREIDSGDYITLGLTSVMAYAGLLLLAQATGSNCKTLVVSAAAGATGAAAVQLGKKVLGIQRVVAIAGSEKKCAFCRDVLGADVALNYKDADFEAQLKEATPDFIDVYFDNVAGPILAQAIARIAFRGKVVACGAISGYQATEDQPAIPLSSYLTLTYQHASVLGVIFTAYKDRMEEISGELMKLVVAGKIVPIKHEVKVGIEDVPSGIELLFSGANVGKLIMKLE